MLSAPGLSLGEGLAASVAGAVGLSVGASGLGLATVTVDAGTQPTVRASPVASASHRIA